MTKERLSEKELLSTLNEMLSNKEDSQDCHFNAVSWHEPDENGINWDAHMGSSGRPILTCKESFEEVLFEARQLYLLKSDND